jgi:cob(I)alamin adenosyltransferase
MKKTQDSIHEKHRITRVYTRGGDGGKTSLASGGRVSKTSARVVAYGSVDELQVHLGAARDQFHLPPVRDLLTIDPDLNRVEQHLAYIQNLLFTLSGDLATPVKQRWDDMPLINQEHLEYLENLIDVLNDELPPLKDFVLPGGHPLVTALHICRVVCRRAECNVFALAESEEVSTEVTSMINRLSDVFFVMSRYVSERLKRKDLLDTEIIWNRDPHIPPVRHDS